MLLLGVLPRAPARVADLGCGAGTLSLLLAEWGCAVDGLDLSPRMIARAQAKLDDRASVRLGDATAPGSSYPAGALCFVPTAG
ncbi:MAG: class I SAM-dependent methyltransferase [Actinomycetota bacterium]|nr:class I SAM-dependent methyltransferase [Actinomycetota bacterium]